MHLKLLLSALGKYLVGLLVVGTLVMLPAGSLEYWQGWLFMAVLFIPIFIVGVVIGNKHIIGTRNKCKNSKNNYYKFQH